MFTLIDFCVKKFKMRSQFLIKLDLDKIQVNIQPKKKECN